MADVSQEYIEQRFDRIEKRMDRFEDLLAKFARVEANQDNSMQGMQRMGTEIDGVKIRLATVERDQARREVPNSWTDKFLYGISIGLALVVLYHLVTKSIHP